MKEEVGCSGREGYSIDALSLPDWRETIVGGRSYYSKDIGFFFAFDEDYVEIPPCIGGIPVTSFRAFRKASYPKGNRRNINLCSAQNPFSYPHLSDVMSRVYPKKIKLPPSIRNLKMDEFAYGIDGDTQFEFPADSDYEFLNGAIIEKSTKTLIKAGNGGFIPDSTRIIGGEAFYFCSNKEIAVPEGVEEIRSFAFVGIEKLILPSSINKLEPRFLCSSNEVAITLPPNDYYRTDGHSIVSSDGVLIFGGVNAPLPSGTKEIGPFSLNIGPEKTPSRSFSIPEGVTKLDCNLLHFAVSCNFILPSTLENIEDGAFSNKTEISGGDVLDMAKCHSLERIGRNAIRLFTNVKLPSALIGEIAQEAFSGFLINPADGLKINAVKIQSRAFCGLELPLLRPKGVTIAIGEGNRYIGHRAFGFGGDENRKIDLLIKIPSTTEYIAGDAFSGKGGSLTFDISPDNPNFVFKDGCLLSRDGQTLYHCPLSKPIPFVRKIADYALSTLSASASISLPPSVEDLGDQDFTYLKSPKKASLYLPPSIKRIGKIEGTALHFLYGGSPSQYKSIEGASSCPLKPIFPFADLARYPSADYLFYTIGDDGSVCIDKCFYPGPYFAVPDSIEGHPVKRLAAFAFASLPNLKVVKLPSSIEDIGDGCFADCSNLAEAILPSSLLRIGESVFDQHHLNQPHKVIVGELPKNIGHVGASCFENAVFNSPLVVPASLLEVGEEAFANSDISEVDVLARWEELPAGLFRGSPIQRISFAYPIKRIGSHCFFSCRLKNFDFSKVEEVEPRAFSYGLNFQKPFKLPAFKRLGFGAFSGCRFNGGVTIGGETKAIPNYLFGNAYMSHLRIEEGVEEVDFAAFADLRLGKNGYISLPDSLRVIRAFALSSIAAWEGNAAAIRLGPNVSFIDPLAFAHANIKIEISEDNPNFLIRDGYLLSKNGKKLLLAFAPSFLEGKLLVPDGITCLGDCSVICKSYPKSLIVPSGIIEMEGNPFASFPYWPEFSWTGGWGKLRLPPTLVAFDPLAFFWRGYGFHIESVQAELSEKTLLGMIENRVDEREMLKIRQKFILPGDKDYENQ